jgi:hypothetical protein
MNRGKRSSDKINKILLEYVDSRIAYYRKKIKSGCTLKDIIQESLRLNEFSMLVELVRQEFPEHKDVILKYLMLQ